MIASIFCLIISCSIYCSEERNIVRETERIGRLRMHESAISMPDSSIVDHAKKSTVIWLFILEEILKFRNEIFK